MKRSSAFITILFFILVTAHTYAQKKTVNENNFDKELLYPTAEARIKFEERKTIFLSKWMDTSVCYTTKSTLHKVWWEFYRKYMKDIYVDNILSNTNGDSLLVLVTAFAADYDSKGNITEGRTFCFGAGVVIDESGQWKFNCNGNTESCLSPNKDAHKTQILWLRNLVLKLGYFKEDGTADPSFFRRLYERNNVH